MSSDDYTDCSLAPTARLQIPHRRRSILLGLSPDAGKSIPKDIVFHHGMDLASRELDNCALRQLRLCLAHSELAITSDLLTVVVFADTGSQAGTVTMYHPDWAATPWQLLLIFYAICIGVFAVVAFGNRILPYIDTVAAGWNLICILVVFLGLSISAKAGRHSAADALAYYDTTLSGWGNWGFAIGLLPAAYTYAAFGMITSMAEEVNEPERTIPKALCYGIPLSAITGLFYILVSLHKFRFRNYDHLTDDFALCA